LNIIPYGWMPPSSLKLSSALFPERYSDVLLYIYAQNNNLLTIPLHFH
jgi:hypothetical protein